MSSARALLVAWLGSMLLLGGCKPERPGEEAAKVARTKPHGSGLMAKMAEQEDEALAAGQAFSRLKPELRAAPVAKVGEHTITLGDVEQQVFDIASSRAYFANLEALKEFFEGYVDYEVLVAESRKMELDRNPVAILATKRALAEALLDDEIRKRAEAVEIADDDIRAEYKAHRERYRTPATVQVLRFVAEGDERIAEAAREKVLAVDEADAEGRLALLRKLIDEARADPQSGATGGELGPISAAAGFPDDDDIPYALRAGALALTSPSDVSPIITIGTQYYFLMLLGRAGGADRNLQDAELFVRNDLIRKRRAAALQGILAELRAKATIETDADVLASLSRPKPDEGAPPRETGAPDAIATPDAGSAETTP